MINLCCNINSQIPDVKDRTACGDVSNVKKYKVYSKEGRYFVEDQRGYDVTELFNVEFKDGIVQLSYK